MKAKRVVIISDLHSGHLVGLTPPDWQYAILASDTEDATKHNKWAKTQFALWNKYTEIIDALKPIDILICNGDAIEGKGERSGSTELITSDRVAQSEMASYCINYAKANKVCMTYGTPYHTGLTEDWENEVFQRVRNAEKIESHGWYDINGVIFDCKHFVSRSSIPHGKATPLGRAYLWNLIWSERDQQPKADIIVRSHVHYSVFTGEPGEWFACTTPALQGMGSKFGSRMCEDYVHWGVLSFDIERDGSWRECWHTVEIAEQKASAIKL